MHLFHWLFSLFVLAHGLVHLLYLAWAQGKMLPEDGFEFTGESWLLTSPLGGQTTRPVGMLLFAASALLFVITGIGLAFRQGWSPNWLALSAVASTLVLILMWDGKLSDLDDKGGIGVLINIALLVALYVFKYPAF